MSHFIWHPLGFFDTVASAYNQLLLDDNDTTVRLSLCRVWQWETSKVTMALSHWTVHCIQKLFSPYVPCIMTWTCVLRTSSCPAQACETVPILPYWILAAYYFPNSKSFSKDDRPASDTEKKLSVGQLLRSWHWWLPCGGPTQQA
jgi:hypothetical protein